MLKTINKYGVKLPELGTKLEANMIYVWCYRMPAVFQL
jgi:hypothetical protein